MDVTFRLDACDSMRGMAMAYVCVSSPQALGNPLDRQACANYRRPTVSDNNYVMSSIVNGYDRLILTSEPSNEVVVGVSVRVIPSLLASPAGLAAFGPSNFEIGVFNGNAVRLRLPWPAAATSSFTPQSFTSGNLTWPVPVVTQFNAAGARNVTAVGVTYNVYVAPVSFSAYASKLFNVSTVELGIVPATACGIERWARLVSANLTSPTGLTSSWLALANLTNNVLYRVMVVAICDAACLRLNTAQLGLPPPSGASLVAQRLPYFQGSFLIPAPVAPVPVVDSSVSPGFFGFVMFLIVVGFGAALFLAFNKEKPRALEVHGTLESSGGAGGIKARAPDGRTIVVRMASHVFTARALRLAEGHADASQGHAVAGAASAGQASRDELEALARISGRVFAAAPVAAPAGGSGAGGGAAGGAAGGGAGADPFA
jgi:hypothetical protein